MPKSVTEKVGRLIERPHGLGQKERLVINLIFMEEGSKPKNYKLRGTIIGAIIGIILSLVFIPTNDPDFYFNPGGMMFFPFLLLLLVPANISELLIKLFGCNFVGFLYVPATGTCVPLFNTFLIITSAIFYGLIGFFAGLRISKVKAKKKLQ